jgi:hypothetical protein
MKGPTERVADAFGTVVERSLVALVGTNRTGRSAGGDATIRDAGDASD